jgi:hypothetical protein
MATILKIELLARIGRHEEALAVGLELQGREVAGRMINGLTPFPLAMAAAETLNGQYQSAAARIDAVIAAMESTGAEGLLVGVVVAERARIALVAGDKEAFERFSAQAIAINEPLRHPGLVARLQTLVRCARSVDQPVSAELARGAELTVMTMAAPTAAIAQLGRMVGQAQPGERAQHALTALIRSAHAAGGYLFGTKSDGVHLLASIEVPPSDETLQRTAAALIAAANAEDDLVTRIEATPQSGSQSQSLTSGELVHAGCGLQPFLLRSAWGKRAALGLALLVAHPGRRTFLHDSVSTTICDGLVQAGDLVAVQLDRA